MDERNKKNSLYFIALSCNKWTGDVTAFKENKKNMHLCNRSVYARVIAFCIFLIRKRAVASTSENPFPYLTYNIILCRIYIIIFLI